jgi:4-amino-4-deoxy-L-arabinose transferase-like glycosyltransferase
LTRGRAWKGSSVGLIAGAWAVLQVGGLWSPGLLDDVDSVYLQVAREMLGRHDFVTPMVDGVRFFDKPPLMYWMAAGSMRVFGVHDWAGRLPLALGVLALLLAVYALGIRLFGERGGFYAALGLATSIGPYLYTRFYIPDILIALWMTLSVHLFLVALERVEEGRSALWPSVGFGAVMALDVLTKGLIGAVFPLGFVVGYLAWTRRLRVLGRLKIWAATVVFLLIAAPWHVLAALRNPAIAMPAGQGLPARAGWAWFYLYNEHVGRFLGLRVPHDYGQTPVWLFWVYALIWVMPWGAFLPGAVAAVRRGFKTEREAAITVTLWTLLVMVFFSISSRQEYYSLPALPALALMLGGFLARAESGDGVAARAARACHLWVLLPVASVVAVVCGYFAAVTRRPANGATLDAMLSSHPALYNVSLGHVFDLTTQALGFFRGPLVAVAAGMVVLGPAAYLLRCRGRAFTSNLLIAGGMVVVLLAAHEGLVRFYPILGSKQLALAIEAERQPGEVVLIDGELTAGSTLLFYQKGTQPVLLVDGRMNGPWFGGFWPDAPQIFADEARLDQLWAGPKRVFLLTYHPVARANDLRRFGPVVDVAAAGGKTVLSNR